MKAATTPSSLAVLVDHHTIHTLGGGAHNVEVHHILVLVFVVRTTVEQLGRRNEVAQRILHQKGAQSIGQLLFLLHNIDENIAFVAQLDQPVVFGAAHFFQMTGLRLVKSIIAVVGIRKRLQMRLPFGGLLSVRHERGELIEFRLQQGVLRYGVVNELLQCSAEEYRIFSCGFCIP